MKKTLKQIGKELLSFLKLFATVFLVASLFVGAILGFQALNPSCGGPAEAGSGFVAEFQPGSAADFDDGCSKYGTPSLAWSSLRWMPATSAGSSLVVSVDTIWTGTNKGKSYNLRRAFLPFDTSTLPEDAIIWSASVCLWVAGSTCQNMAVTPRVVLTESTRTNFVDVVIADHLKWTDTRFCTSIARQGSGGYYITFELNQVGLDYINTTGVTDFCLRDYIWDTLDNDPYINIGSGEENTIVSWSFADNSEYSYPERRPKLTVVYGDEPIDRGETQNPENDDEGGSGDSVTAIDWKTVRCAYSDEELGFRISGTAGTELSLHLLTEGDIILDSCTDTIRVDGYFYWKAACGLGDSGFVRCKEVNHSVFSDWGYVAPKPDGTQIHNYTYAGITSYPQFRTPFSTYIVDEEGLMAIHWKTDVQDDELADYSFRLYHLGDSADTLYSQTFEWMLDNYWDNCYDANDFQAGIRYVLVKADTADDMDGLIIDLDRTYIGANQGFYQGLIYQEGVGEYSVTHSAHCYIKNLGGILIALDAEDYDASAMITVSIDIDAETGGLVMWDRYLLENFLEGQSAPFQTVDNALTSGSFENSQLSSFNQMEDCVVRVTFYDSSPGCSFKYIFEIPYTIEGGIEEEEEEGPIEDLIDWFGDLGLGTWAVMLILMVIAFLVFYQSKVLRVVVPILIFGLFLVSGWLDIWVVVLLALGAGVTLFFLLRRGHGGGES